jgi:photosystem II stability/assembly factor-like uncharacterized protein
MAEETLGRVLDRAFDPGPDFPNRLLLSRTMAALEAANLRPSRRPWFGFEFPRPARPIVASVVIIAVALAATGAFVAVNQHVHPAAPARHSQFLPSTGVATVAGMSALSANDAAVWGLYNIMREPNKLYDTSTIFITHDGGKTWLPSVVDSFQSGALSSVGWTDTQHLVIYLDNGNGTNVWTTSDGGSDWQAAQWDFPASTEFPIVRVIDGQTAVVLSDVRSSRLVYVTQNAGATWSKASLTPPPGGWSDSFQAQNAFMFGSDGVVVVARYAATESYVYTTADGGRTWSEPRALRGISLNVVTAREWWLVDRFGQASLSLDAGQSWQQVRFHRFVDTTLTSIVYASGDVVWAIADGAIPIRSTDQGMHWSIVKVPA